MAGWLSESAYLDLLPTLLGLTAAILLTLPPRSVGESRRRRGFAWASALA